jgi:hypothetical protein
VGRQALTAAALLVPLRVRRYTSMGDNTLDRERCSPCAKDEIAAKRLVENH